MSKNGKNKLARIIAFAILILLIACCTFAVWISYRYKQILAERLPLMIAKSTDSVYHISFRDIHVHIFTHNITLTGLELWPDQKQVEKLKSAHRHIPPTLSTVSIPLLEASGLVWKDIIDKGILDCGNVTVHQLKWLMVCRPNPQDSLLQHDQQKKPYISLIRAEHIDFNSPNIIYHYEGIKDSFSAFLRGGKASLQQFIYNFDERQDTSLFLYARSGKLRPDTFIFRKKVGIYTVRKPLLDFETTLNSITLKDVKLKQMVDHNPNDGEKEIYDFDLPSIKLMDFNWNQLINKSILQTSDVIATDPKMNIRYIDKNQPQTNKMGSYPHQLLLQVGLQTNLATINIHNGYFKYTEVTKKDGDAVIEFTNIQGHFTNITNMTSIIAKHKSCTIKLKGKYMNKSDVSSTFDFYLGDTSGRFKMDGILENLDGEDVMKQAQALTIVEVTSFHLDKMDMHIEGDGSYAKGNFTVLYKDLKISLLKFKSNFRKGKHGPFSFLGSALILYPSNPMPGSEPRQVTTSFARDPQKGFIGSLWENIYRAAKKSAVRNENLVNITDGKESSKGEERKKGFFQRLFGKKH